LVGALDLGVEAVHLVIFSHPGALGEIWADQSVAGM
jgi:hypothetical protein